MAIPYYKAFEALLHKTVSGKEFNQIVKKTGRKFYKLTNQTENHNGLQYLTGLNADSQKFKGSYNSPGLYFTEERFVHNWEKTLIKTGYPMYFKRKVTIPDDAKVYYDYDEVKTDKMVLGQKEKLCLVYESRFPLYKSMTGKEFNDLCILSQKNQQPVRMTFSVVYLRDTEFHTGFHKADWLHWKFIDDSQISEYKKKLLNVLCDPPYFWHRKIFARSVIIPDDAKVLCEYDQFLTDKIILGDEKEL